MATHDSEQGRPEQEAGAETRPGAASKSPQGDSDDDPQRVNLKVDWRAEDSSGTEDAGVAEDRLRDGK